jgi:DNA-binding CsgD family transcriptional regulator
MNNRGFIVAADNFLVRTGMVSLLNKMNGVRVIREFGDVESLMRFAQKNPGHFLVISQSLFNEAGDLFLSSPELLERTILIADDIPPGENTEVQASILPGDQKSEITSKISSLLIHQGKDGADDPSEILTKREITIVRLVSLGMTNRQIADQLFLSTHTVITHRKNISSKLGIRSVSGITVYAIVNNIITIEEVTSKP